MQTSIAEKTTSLALPVKAFGTLHLMKKCADCGNQVNRDQIAIECALCGSLCDSCHCTCNTVSAIDLYLAAALEFERSQKRSIDSCITRKGTVVAIEDDCSNLEWIAGDTSLLLTNPPALQEMLFEQLPLKMSLSHRQILDQSLPRLKSHSYVGTSGSRIWSVWVMPFCLVDRKYSVTLFES